MLYYNIRAANRSVPVQVAAMKWFRSNVRYGSRLALFALAVQMVLSFGHFHAAAAQGATAAVQTGFALSDLSFDPEIAAQDPAAASLPQPGSSDDRDQRRPSDPCAICAVMAMANAVLFSQPPVLLLPQAVEFLYLATDAEFVHLNSARADFQPRAPPAS